MLVDRRHEAIESLAPFETLPDWLAAGMDGERVAGALERAVSELSSGETRIVACRPERLRAKGDEWIARYRVTVADRDDRRSDVILIGRLWAPDQGTCPTDGSGPLRFGDPGWTCWLPDLRLELVVEMSDESLPALPTLVEPDKAARLIERILVDAGYGSPTIATCEPDVVRYKPGSRCTVVVRLTYADVGASPTPPSPVVLKTHQGDKGQVAWAAMTELWARRAAWDDAVTLAEPLAYYPDDRILAQGPIPEERTLKELAREAIGTRNPALLDELRRNLAMSAVALARIHESGAIYGRTATYDEELAEIREVIARLATTVPKLEMAAEPLLDRLAELAEDVPADPMVPAHHDFRPAQVLLDGGRIGFIDFDGAAMAEPALDLGRFRAKLRDIGVSTIMTDGGGYDAAAAGPMLDLVDELCEGFLAAYEERRPVSRTRVSLWETADLMTAMLHAWTKVRLARLEPRMAVLRHQLRTSMVA
jgi:hypothetical protein